MTEAWGSLSRRCPAAEHREQAWEAGDCSVDSVPETWARVAIGQPQCPSSPHIYPTEVSKAGALGRSLLSGGNDRKGRSD